ncbi:ABC transporter permease subunit [Vallitaleaceae bacterium 9-2]
MLFVVVKKELLRVFTDRRLVFSAFILPALSIFILYSLMGKMIGNMTQSIEENIPTVKAANAPESFREYMATQSIPIEYIDMKALDTTKEEILTGTTELLLVFSENFEVTIQEYATADKPDIHTFYNPSEEYSQSAKNTFEYTLLPEYETMLLTQRFDGINAFTAFTIDRDNEQSKIAQPGKEAGFSLAFMMPMLLNIMLFAGAMGIGIDVIAGEKERGTMATMLLTPVNRETIAMGKVISLGIVAIVSAICTFGAIIASLPNASALLAAGNEVSIAGLAFTGMDYLMLLVILIVQVGVFVGLICLISVIAKSVKEAGTYISPIYILVMISAFGTVFTTGDVKLYNYFIPVMGNVFAIKELLLKELSYMEFGVTVGVSLVLIGILLKLITLAFNHEKIMFN